MILLNLKISKLMAKYGLKPLNISIYGGNITMMMINRFIIWMQHITHDHNRIEMMS